MLTRLILSAVLLAGWTASNAKVIDTATDPDYQVVKAAAKEYMVVLKSDYVVTDAAMVGTVLEINFKRASLTGKIYGELPANTKIKSVRVTGSNTVSLEFEIVPDNWDGLGLKVVLASSIIVNLFLLAKLLWLVVL